MYSRKYDTPIDFNAYQDWCSKRGAVPSIMNDTMQDHLFTAENELALNASPTLSPVAASISDQAAPYPMSFNHIVSLISSGEPVPGIKEIPDTTLEGQASEATSEKRRKPWEKSTDDRG